MLLTYAILKNWLDKGHHIRAVADLYHRRPGVLYLALSNPRYYEFKQ